MQPVYNHLVQYILVIHFKKEIMQSSDITIIKGSTIINDSINTVWNIIKNPEYIHLYHPLIKDSFMLSEKGHGVDSKRKCMLLPMGVMIERITDWQEGVSYTTEVIDGKMLPPFSFMTGTIQLKTIDTHETEATFTFEYKLKYGILGRIMNAILIKPQFRSAPTKYVNGLKNYIEKL